MNFKANRNTSKLLLLIPAVAIQIVASGFSVKAEDTTPSKGLTNIKENIDFFNKDVITVNAGDNLIANKLLNSIYEDGVSLAVTPIKQSSETPNTIRYTVGSYEVTFENFDPTAAGKQDVYMYLQNKSKSNISDKYKLNAVDTKDSDAATSDVIHTYRLHLEVVDTAAPVLELTQTNMVIEQGEAFDPNEYVANCYDPVDGALTYSVESNVDTETPGEYVAIYTTTDKNGNVAENALWVSVAEKEEEQPVVANTPVASSNSYSYTGSVSNVSGNGSSIVSSALGQIGVYQDCTSLVSRALAASGIYYHGYPAGYLSLGPTVSASQAQPGDIIYYADGGIGYAHVAIYIGNGQAVHGGWRGNNTVIASAYVGSGPVFIHIAR